MKRLFLILFMALSLIPFAGTAIAEDEKGPKLDAAELKIKGTVVTYAEGSTITVKSSQDEEFTFLISENTRVKGKVKEGRKVRVTYEKDGENMVATKIKSRGGKKMKKGGESETSS